LTSATRPRRTAILVSGGGTNLQAIIDAWRTGKLTIEPVLVISNRADAHGLVRAKNAGIDAVCVPHADYPRRASFDAALAQQLDNHHAELVLLAGFMRILTPEFVARYPGRLLNIHPSLLPLYPGLDTHRRVIEAGDAWHGSTVHFVSEQLDGGPRIIQGRVPVMPDDDPQSLAARVLAVEHRIYPQAVQLVADGRVTYADGAAWLDGNKLSEPLQVPD
jgi:phosphoribosylglycinamide formyltransferase-1